MATIVHQAGVAKLIGGGVNLGSVARSFQAEGVIATADATVLESTARQFASNGTAGTVGGVCSGTYNAEGFLTVGTDGDSAYEVLQRMFADESVIVSASIGDAVGKPAVGLVAGTTMISTPVQLGETVGFSLQGETRNGFEPGVVALPWGERTGTVNGTSIDAGASSARGAAAFVAIGDFVGTNCIVKIQHSTDNSSWADAGTFTTITAGRGGERLWIAPGTLNRYRRAAITGGTFTSIELIVALAAM